MFLPLGDLEKTRIVPVVTYALITLNVVVYLVQIDRGDPFTAAYAITPYEISHREDLTEPVPVPVRRAADPLDPDAAVPVAFRMVDQAPGPVPIWLTLITGMFLHGSPLHLASNMLFLWIFGDNVEEVLGGARYLIAYLACGVVGSLCQVAAAPDSVIPTVGASGAIAGTMGAYLVWFPHNRIRVLLFRFITVMPAVYVVGFWVVSQVFAGFGSLGSVGQTGGVAYLAHVGGAATGIFVAFLFPDRARYVRDLNASLQGWYPGDPP